MPCTRAPPPSTVVFWYCTSFAQILMNVWGKWNLCGALWQTVTQYLSHTVSVGNSLCACGFTYQLGGWHQASVCMQCCTSSTVHQENLAVCSWVNETINVPWGMATSPWVLTHSGCCALAAETFTWLSAPPLSKLPFEILQVAQTPNSVCRYVGNAACT